MCIRCASSSGKLFADYEMRLASHLHWTADCIQPRADFVSRSIGRAILSPCKPFSANYKGHLSVRTRATAVGVSEPNDGTPCRCLGDASLGSRLAIFTYRSSSIDASCRIVEPLLLGEARLLVALVQLCYKVTQ